METENQYDVCIIGAGVAGGVLAAYLGNNGLKVAVVEKNLAEQERMIGELLQPGGVIKLQELGLEHLLHGLDAQAIEGYGLFMNGDLRSKRLACGLLQRSGLLSHPTNLLKGSTSIIRSLAFEATCH